MSAVRIAQLAHCLVLSHMPGRHVCRYGYKSIWEVEQVVENYTAANIPLEAMWTDIDYMSGFRDFTFDESTFPQKEVQV